jgi:hypothetical protein
LECLLQEHLQLDFKGSWSICHEESRRSVGG